MEEANRTAGTPGVGKRPLMINQCRRSLLVQDREALEAKKNPHGEENDYGSMSLPHRAFIESN